MDTGLASKRVLVTGASGGIGSATARAFAAEGCRLALHFHRGRERADALGQEVPDAVLLQADLRDETEVDTLFAEARDRLGGLDVCAAVAGVWPEEDTPVWELPLARWEEDNSSPVNWAAIAAALGAVAALVGLAFVLALT